MSRPLKRFLIAGPGGLAFGFMVAVGTYWLFDVPIPPLTLMDFIYTVQWFIYWFVACFILGAIGWGLWKLIEWGKEDSPSKKEEVQ